LNLLLTIGIIIALLNILDHVFPYALAKDKLKAMRIVLISDTHGLHADLLIPEGDMLIHAGDITMDGTIDEINDFNTWFNSLSHPHKIVIAGNHDFSLQKEARAARKKLTNCHYLFDSFIKCEGLKIYGSPWQPWFHDFAFNLDRGEPLKKMWKMIPIDTDILVTHGPPFEILDAVSADKLVGCKDLLERVKVVKPKVHIFGHVHQAYGEVEQDGTKFINCSICDVDYNPVNLPIVIDI
jgi:Icc-related predicted phosphoesterase